MGYSISKFSKMTGISTDALRHYERCGLLSPAINPENGYRIYSDADAVQAYMIKNYRGMHMPIPEIAQSFQHGSFKHTQKWLSEHVEHLEAEIARLQLLRTCYHARLYSIGNAMEEKNVVTELDLPPACHLYYDDCKSDTNKKDQALLQKWTNSIPFVTYMFRLDKDDIIAGRETTPHLGLGSRLHIVEEFGLPITPPARLYTGGHGLRMRILTHDLFDIGLRELRPMLDYAHDKGWEIAADAVFMVDALEIESGASIFHVDLHFQVH